jgi:hypothetical protein
MKRPIPELLDHDRHAAPNIAPWPPKFLISDIGLVPADPYAAERARKDKHLSEHLNDASSYQGISMRSEASKPWVSGEARAEAELELRRRGHARNMAAGEAAIRSWAELSTPRALSAFDRHTLYAAVCLGICIGCIVGLYL